MPINNPDNRVLTGSAIVDGTSYGGCDIKAIVHIYDKANAVDSRIKELEQRIETVADPLVKAALMEQAQFFRSNRLSFTTKVLAEMQTVSVSTYREKYPVRSLGAVYPKNFTRGPRTIAGSMVFSVFDKNVLFELLEADATEFDAYNSFTSALIDQLPPFDITIAFANELGQTSRMTIYGVEFVSEGQTMSIHDIFIENQVQYLARDVDPMTKTGEAVRDQNMQIVSQGFSTITGSSLLGSTEAAAYKKQIDPFSRFKTRNEPFL